MPATLTDAVKSFKNYLTWYYYWPISDTTPATSQNDRLMEFAGKKVSVTGKVYSRGGSYAIVMGKIEAASAGK